MTLQQQQRNFIVVKAREKDVVRIDIQNHESFRSLI